jgi:hypothetical protein
MSHRDRKVMTMITVHFTDRDGDERDIQVAEGTKVSGIVANFKNTMLNDEQVTRDVELRDGDELREFTPSSKAAC